MVEIKQEPINRLTQIKLYIFSTIITAVLIIFALMVLNDFSLNVIEGTWIINVAFIGVITFIFNLLFLSSELKKSQFNSLQIRDDRIMIDRDKKKSDLNLSTVRYFNLDQHFYRLIGYYRFTIVSGSQKKILDTFVINKTQLKTVLKTKDNPLYSPLWRETKKKETP